MSERKSRKRLRKEYNRIARKQFERQRLLNRFAEPGPHPFIIVLDHLKPDFNIGKIFRTVDALGGAGVYLVGTDFFHPAPAKGSFKWVPARFFDDFAACHAVLRQQGYQVFVLEPANSACLTECRLPPKSAFVLGHEEFGISFDKDDYPEIQALRIPQWGKVESLNVSIAAALVMYEYIRQHAAAPPSPPPANRHHHG